MGVAHACDGDRPINGEKVALFGRPYVGGDHNPRKVVAGFEDHDKRGVSWLIRRRFIEVSNASGEPKDEFKAWHRDAAYLTSAAPNTVSYDSAVVLGPSSSAFFDAFPERT